MSEWKRAFIHMAAPTGFPIHKPYAELTQSQKDLLWHGGKGFEGIDGFSGWWSRINIRCNTA